MCFVCLETEAKDHHRLLDDVGGDFDSSSGNLTFLPKMWIGINISL